jgi:signal transducing adaptor molecule
VLRTSLPSYLKFYDLFLFILDYKFEQPEEAPPPTVDDEIRRKEEEELQRVLEMSMQDRGGRNQWSNYSVAAGSSSSSAPAGASGSKSSAARSNPTPTAQTTAPSGAGSSHHFAAPKYSDGGYVPARTPSPNTVAAQQRQQQQYYQAQLKQHSTSAPSAAPEATPAPAAAPVAAAPAPAVSSSTTPAGPSVTPNMNIVTRVRALHTFEPTEPGELAFEKGDIIKVVDRGYKDWWRGQLKGRTGIFPVNYVVSTFLFSKTCAVLMNLVHYI